jgi:hypothetical protein
MFGGLSQPPSGGRRGYSLPEVMIAGSLTTLVMVAIMTAFLWAGRQSLLCSKIAWSQSEVMKTSGRIEQFIRNASAISSIDESLGNWVEVRFPDGSTGRFVYYREDRHPRDGSLYLIRKGEPDRMLARGLMKITTTDGFPTPVFSKINDRSIRISFRLSEPTPEGKRAPDDRLYAGVARLAVCLRNAEE